MTLKVICQKNAFLWSLGCRCGTLLWGTHSGPLRITLRLSWQGGQGEASQECTQEAWPGPCSHQQGGPAARPTRRRPFPSPAEPTNLRCMSKLGVLEDRHIYLGGLSCSLFQVGLHWGIKRRLCSNCPLTQELLLTEGTSFRRFTHTGAKLMTRYFQEYKADSQNLGILVMILSHMQQRPRGCSGRTSMHFPYGDKQEKS